MLIAAALCVADRRALFAVVVVISIFCDEKVALVLAAWLSIRCLARTDRALLWPQWTIAVATVVCYAAIVKLMDAPGYSYQLEPASFPATIADNLATSMTARGVLLNILPTAVIVVLAAIGSGRAEPWFRPADLLVIPALLVVGLVFTQSFQIGRIVMHAAPIFVVPAIAALRPSVSAK
jgi:hypothetical protein